MNIKFAITKDERLLILLKTEDNNIEVEVYANSHSLKVESRPEDAEIIKKCLGLTYD